MKELIVMLITAITLTLVAAGCGGGPKQAVNIDIRPLGENKAFEIVEELLAGRSYTAERNVNIELSSKLLFPCDYRITGHPIGIEFLTEQDRLTMGSIPPPASGSRLHVLKGYSTLPGDNTDSPRREMIYVFFIDDRNFTYHFNPTSETRADITLPEVDSRIRRDLADFLSWYEASIIKSK